MTNKDVVLMLFVVLSTGILFIYLMVTYTREINKFNRELEEDEKQQADRRRSRMIEANNAQMQRIKRQRELENRGSKQEWDGWTN